MDIDVFPNSIEYRGANGMVLFGNIQARWTPWPDGGSRLAVSLERPGASSDRVQVAGILRDIRIRFSAKYSFNKSFGGS